MLNKDLMLREGKYVKFRNYKRKIKSIFTIHADFKSTFVQEDN